MAKTFTAQIEGFADTTWKNMRADVGEGINQVVEGMQTPARGISKGGSLQVGKIPVAEAELINSLSSDGGAPSADSYVVAIAGFEIGDFMTFSYTAPHAFIKEVGNSKMEGWHFMGVNARKFPQIMEDIVKARR